MGLTPEKILSNFEEYRSLLEKTGTRAEAALNMVDSLGERLVMCPASARVDYHNCFPGGLVDHSLRVLKNCLSLMKAFDWKLSKESVIIGTLFHDLGKVGDHVNSYYVPQTDSWKRDKLGELYTYNRSMQYMSVPHRGIFLCQHYGVKLTEDEMLAILLNDGQYDEANAKYKLKEPALADAVHMADLIATKYEKANLLYKLAEMLYLSL